MGRDDDVRCRMLFKLHVVPKFLRLSKMVMIAHCVASSDNYSEEDVAGGD